MDIIKLAKVENVRMIDRYSSKNAIIGTLYLTATHLIFVEPDTNKETWILHMHIGSVEKLPLSTTGSPLLIRCKTFLSVTFIISKDSECHDIYTSLIKLHQPMHISKLYCFSYSPGQVNVMKNTGWNYFALENEYKRMSVPNDKWTLCTLNQSYQLCDTYPAQLFVPSDVGESTLVGSSKFRSKGRLPVLTYLNHNMAAICRCSQPLSGFSARCPEDEQMLECIRKANPNAKFMYVVDTRPRINAMANRATGKGYENEAFYENIKFQFLGIENIHVMRSSLQKLIEACEQKSLTMSGLLNTLESTGWLKHIRSILETSRFIANAVNNGISVVVHCSDGWDRTAQVCSMAAIMLDPFYRTIEGFQVLIEKDWLAFGYKFSDRCGHLQMDSKEVSPIFIQFLDSTWQLMNQRNNFFEFNERFLLSILDHVYSCQFGTFIGNCEKDRLELKLSERTYSFWYYLANNLNEYVNPLYNPDEVGIIIPDLAAQNIKYWRGMYSRFESGVHPREPIADYLLVSRDHSVSLKDHKTFLLKKIATLQSQISKWSSSGLLHCENSTMSRGCPDGFGLDKNLGKLDQRNYSSALKYVEFKLPETCKFVDELAGLNSISIDWKHLRNSSSCSCSAPFDQFSKKIHCWKCGHIFCSRCVEKAIPLLGENSANRVPMCKPCSRSIQKVSP